MRFTYTYRSSDGERHTAGIEAGSRDAAFAAIRRELGIKPIKVVAEMEESQPEGDHPGLATAGGALPRTGRARNGRARALLTGAAAILAAVLAATAVAGGLWWWLAARPAGAPQGEGRAPARPPTRETPEGQGPAPAETSGEGQVYTEVTPLPRQMISGDRRRVERAARSIFKSDAEAYLSRFAEPGRPAAGVPPPAESFVESLKTPLRASADELTEYIDLKRIVEGMKQELKAYLDGGGTVEQYLAELAERQIREMACRKKAEERISELLDDPKAAYDYWLKANASLKSMGIYELPLPDPLRSYQMSLDIDE